jgi:hypothetical protein
VEDYELLALQFDSNDTPKFNDSVKKMEVENEDFTIYYSNECPYVEYEVKELSDYIAINFKSNKNEAKFGYISFKLKNDVLGFPNFDESGKDNLNEEEF